ncbi:hypothetical protein EVAR_32999_1 [Eumeta japonica]|uniref:Uncharacterized protein n=1 Tax=Eumeta variegata TaxID=151549 RepID=A0A4C1VSD4_EUMVA|nr:hypothetical protein EVAR_32999_1 [Eumeta japonica]
MTALYAVVLAEKPTLLALDLTFNRPYSNIHPSTFPIILVMMLTQAGRPEGAQCQQALMSYVLADAARGIGGARHVRSSARPLVHNSSLGLHQLPITI